MWTWNISSKTVESEKEEEVGGSWYVINVAGPQGKGIAPIVRNNLCSVVFRINKLRSLGFYSFTVFTGRDQAELEG